MARVNEIANSYPCLFAKLLARTYPRSYMFTLLSPGIYSRLICSSGSYPPVPVCENVSSIPFHRQFLTIYSSTNCLLCFVNNFLNNNREY